MSLRGMLYHFKIHKDGDSFWAECIELPGCFTQANSKEKLLVNMQIALNLYLAEDIKYSECKTK